jgi:NitT/TauT family transport system substrate-binding protein
VHRLAAAIRLVLIGAVLAVAPSIALSQTKIRFQLDWITDGQHAPFWLAHYKGYFKDEGVDVQLDLGSGSAATVARLASTTYDMGYGDTTALIEFLSQHGHNPVARIQAVYMVQEATPAGMVFKTRTGITAPKDLAGKTFGAPVFDTGRKLWPLFALAQGLDPASVKWQGIDPALRAQMLVRDQIDVVTGFQPSTHMSVIAAGARTEDVKSWYYKDFGVKAYGNAILVRPQFLADKPKAVAGFVRAFNRALKETIASPEAAIKFVKQREPLIDEALELRRLKGVLDQFIATPTARDNGLGAISKLRLENQVDQVTQALKLSTTPNADQIFNSSFLPPRGERSF